MNQKGCIKKRILKIVNSAVNVCSNLIGCFEVVALAPHLYCYLSETYKGSLSLFFIKIKYEN